MDFCFVVAGRRGRLDSGAEVGFDLFIFSRLMKA